MKNVTITLDEKTAAWARASAAKRNMSVSRFVGEMLQEKMHDQREYNEAMRNFFSHKPFVFEFEENRRPTREELNVRPRFR